MGVKGQPWQGSFIRGEKVASFRWTRPGTKIQRLKRLVQYSSGKFLLLLRRTSRQRRGPCSVLISLPKNLVEEHCAPTTTAELVVRPSPAAFSIPQTKVVVRPSVSSSSSARGWRPSGLAPCSRPACGRSLLRVSCGVIAVRLGGHPERANRVHRMNNAVCRRDENVLFRRRDARACAIAEELAANLRQTSIPRAAWSGPE